jgi:hypothetical protein
MANIQVEVKLSSEDLLKAVSQLSSTDLEKFVAQVLELRAQRKAAHLSRAETELLLKINQGISWETQQNYAALISKRQAELLTLEEQRELLTITEQIEKLEAQRVEALAELAKLKGISLINLMNELGIQPATYV